MAGNRTDCTHACAKGLEEAGAPPLDVAALAPPGGGAPAAPAPPDNNASAGTFLQQALEQAEVSSARQWVHFITSSRALYVENAQRLEDISREEVASAVQDAFDSPVGPGARAWRPIPRRLQRARFLYLYHARHGLVRLLAIEKQARS